MKFYSEVTKKFYDSEKECVKAEKLHEDKLAKEKLEKEQLAAERKAAAEKVEVAYDAYVSAKEAYVKEINSFCEKYGSYHTTIKRDDGFTSFFKTLFY